MAPNNRRFIFFSLVFIVSLALSACAGTPAAVPATTAPAKAPAIAATVAPTTTAARTLTLAATAAMTGAPAGATVAAGESTIKIARNATLGNILVDSWGMTLYTFKNDTPNQSNCTAGCLQNWPRLTVPAKVTPLAAVGIPGKLGVIEPSTGVFQVTYDQMPLYFYTPDTVPGDAKGQGLNNLWYVITVPFSTPVPTANDQK